MHINLINGLLGSGKTTVLLNLLEQRTKDGKVVVLVNEFGEIGIDGDLLSKKGADVVELPNGCICCTLTSDLRSQIATIAQDFCPNQLFIEPTGIATIKNLLVVLRSLSLEKYIESLTITVVLDASTFEEIRSQNRGFVETQIEMADIIILNKCDLVAKDQINHIKQIVHKTNNSVQIISTTFGKVLEQDYQVNFQKVSSRPNHNHLGPQKDKPDVPLKQYQQFSQKNAGFYNLQKLRTLFEMVKDCHFGDVDRAKGLFQMPDKSWVRFDLASHIVTEFVMKETFNTNKIIVIGTGLNKKALTKELKNCLLMG